MKILISAYSCETGRGSEGEIGWQIANALAERHDVRVITRANLRQVHEASYMHLPKPAGLQFVYFDLPWIFRFYKKGGRFFLLYYYLWQIGVALKAWRLLRTEPADVLHHLIGGMDWLPTGLAICPGLLVWGPVGSENTHPALRAHLPLRSRIKDRSRLAMRWIMRNLDPLIRLTGARASVILSHTPETAPSRYGPKLRAFTQTGIAPSPAHAREKSDFSRHAMLRLLFAGELKDWKGARMALDAALKFFESEPNATLTIVGNGPLRAEMEAAAGAHPEGSRVTFTGRVPMVELVEALYSADVFLYPSFHHGLATVILQAMLTGLPIVCIEGDATGRVVGQEAGITVPLASDRMPVDDLAAAIAILAKDEEKRQALARRAQSLVRERYAYDSIVAALDRIYEDIAGRA